MRRQEREVSESTATGFENTAIIYQYDAIVVLGAGVSDTSVRRLEHGLELLKRGLARVLVFMGGSEEEERLVKAVVESHGVEAARVHVDTNSKNTVDNAYYAKAILKKLGARKVALVTSEFHVQRALAIFDWVLGDEYVIEPFPVQDNPDESLILKEEVLKTFIPLMKALFAKGDDEGIKKLADLLDPFIDALV